MMKMPSKLVTVMQSEKYESGFPPDNLLAFQEWLSAQIELVPASYRDTAIIEIASTTQYDCDYATVEIYYTRPMTQDEVDEQSLNEIARRAQEVARLQAELARLGAS